MHRRTSHGRHTRTTHHFLPTHQITPRTGPVPHPTVSSVASDYEQLRTLLGLIEHDRREYCPAHVIQTLAPAIPLLIRSLPAPGVIASLELLMWAQDQCGDYKNLKQLGATLIQQDTRQWPSAFINRIAYLTGGEKCDHTPLGQATRWLAGAVRAIDNTILTHDVFRLPHHTIYQRIMMILQQFPLGDTFTLHRLIMNLTNEELRNIAIQQATYNVGAPKAVPCLAPKDIRVRPRIVFTGEDFNARPTGLLIRRFVDHPPPDMDIFIIQIGPPTPESHEYSFRDKHVRYFEVTTVEAAQTILSQHRFDAIIDTKGLMFKNHCSLLSPRRAPLQVHWLAYPGTIGIPNLDYIIGDPIVTPRDNSRHALEHVIRLPECYQINDDAFSIQPMSDVPRMVRRPGRMLMACVNMNYKICPDTIDAWNEILRRCPHVDLAIVCRSKDAITNISHAFRSAGISADRIQVHIGQLRPQFLANMKHDVDVAVDPFRCPGHTTASDAYTAGVPVVSLYTDTYHGSVAHSLATTLGLSAILTATSSRDYVDKVIALLSDPDLLTEVRSEVRFQRRWNTLYDPYRYMSHFWDGLRIAFRRCKTDGWAAKDINVRPQPRFMDPVDITAKTFTFHDRTNRAVTRLLLDGEPVIVSAWHNEVWVGKRCVTTSFRPEGSPDQTPSTLAQANVPLRITRSGKKSAVLQGATPVLLGIPYPSAVACETGTVLDQDCVRPQ